MSPQQSLPEFIANRHAELLIGLEGTYALYALDPKQSGKKRFTRHMNFPERSSLELTMRLAYRLQLHPLTLINDYGMGRLMIPEDCKKQLKQHYIINPYPNAQTTKRTDKPGPPPKPDRRPTGDRRTREAVLQK